MSMSPESAKHRVRHTPRKPASTLAEKLDDDRRRRRVLPRVAAPARRCAGHGPRPRLRPVGPLPAADRGAPRGRVPHLRARSARLRAQRQAQGHARHPRPRACDGRLPGRSRRRAGVARRQLDGVPGDHRVRPPLPRAHRARRPRLAGRRAVQPAAAARDRPALARRAARADPHGAGRGARLRAIRRAQHDAPVPGADPVPVTAAPAGDEDPDSRRARGARSRCCPGPIASTRSPARPTATCSSCCSRAPRTPSTSAIPTSSRTSSGCSWTTSRS